MKEKRYVKVVNRHEAIIECSVEYEELNSAEWKLAFFCPDCVPIEVIQYDVFQCLVQIRMHLEESGAYILCSGARKDVYPSSMSRQMSGGLKAYKREFGKSPRLEDLVDIFDYADRSLVGSVKDQYDFYMRWASTL